MEFLISYINYSAKPGPEGKRDFLTHGKTLNVHICFGQSVMFLRGGCTILCWSNLRSLCLHILSTLSINNLEESTLTLNASCRKHRNEIFSHLPRRAMWLGENHSSTWLTVKLVSKFPLFCRIFLSGSWEAVMAHCYVWKVKQVRDRQDFKCHCWDESSWQTLP